MATKLSGLEITEISGVDKGANPGAKAVLVKRDTSEIKPMTYLEKALNALLHAARLDKAKGKPTPTDPDGDGDGDDDTTTDPTKNPDADEDAKNGTLAKSEAAGSAGNTVTQEESMTDITKALAAKDAEIVKLKEDLEKAKNPPMTAEEEAAEKAKCAKAALAALPEDVRKKLDAFEEVQKQNAVLVEKAEVEEFTKRATTCGLPADAVPHLRAIAKADPKAMEYVEKLAKQLQALAKNAPMFREIGSVNGPDASSATGQLETIAAGYITKAAGGLTKDQAMAKALADHPELYSQYCAESAARA